jgi:hypothetical protein
MLPSSYSSGTIPSSSGGEKLRSGRTMVIFCATKRKKVIARHAWIWMRWPVLCWVGAGRPSTWRCGWFPGSAARQPDRWWRGRCRREALCPLISGDLLTLAKLWTRGDELLAKGTAAGFRDRSYLELAGRRRNSWRPEGESLAGDGRWAEEKQQEAAGRRWPLGGGEAGSWSRCGGRGGVVIADL